MKVENQVCNVDIARKLWSLKVTANAGLSWIYSDAKQKWDLSHLNVEALKIIDDTNKGDKHYKAMDFYPAYSVAELGCMFGGATTSTERLYNNVQRKLNQGLSFAIVFNPDFLAKELIYSIVNGLTTHSDCNNRLNG